MGTENIGNSLPEKKLICRKCKKDTIYLKCKNRKTREGQTYRFGYYWYCPKCRMMYMDNRTREIIVAVPRQDMFSLNGI